MGLDSADARRTWFATLDGDEPDEAERSARRERTTTAIIVSFTRYVTPCGAWLASAGELVRSVKIMMRHGSIGQTMNTYGHRFPGAAENVVSTLGSMMIGMATLPIQTVR